MGSATAGAEQSGANGWPGGRDQVNRGLRQDPLLQGSRTFGTGLQSQRSLGPAAPQRQNHFDGGGTSSNDREGDCAVGILGGDEGQGRLQWLDRHALSTGSADGADIQAEQTEVEGWAIRQDQAALDGVQPGDFRLHERHAGSITEGPQIDGQRLRWIDPGDQGGNHA